MSAYRFAAFAGLAAACLAGAASAQDFQPKQKGVLMLNVRATGVLTDADGAIRTAAGADSVSLAGGTVPGGSVTAPGNCQIQVDVVRTGGTVGNASITNVIATGAVTNAQAKATWSRSPPPSARAATWASTWSRASRKAAPWAAAPCR